MKIRLRQLPIETLEKGQQVLCMAQQLGEKDFMQGPCVLEYAEDSETENYLWKPVEFVK
jgi:hypothetical protein